MEGTSSEQHLSAWATRTEAASGSGMRLTSHSLADLDLDPHGDGVAETGDRKP